MTATDETTTRGLRRVTTNFTPKGFEALIAAAARTRDSRTDTINRAVQLYDLLTEEQAGGATLLLRAADGEMGQLRIL